MVNESVVKRINERMVYARNMKLADSGQSMTDSSFDHYSSHF